MSTEQEFKIGDKVVVVDDVGKNTIMSDPLLLARTQGRVLTINGTAVPCAPTNNECKVAHSCAGYGIRVKEEPLNNTTWCAYVFKKVRNGRKHETSVSNLRLPSSKDWRKIIGK